MSLQIDVPSFDDLSQVQSFLQDQFLALSIELNKSKEHIQVKVMPTKPKIGKVYYFGNPVSNTYDVAITSEGWWGYKTTGWSQLG